MDIVGIPRSILTSALVSSLIESIGANAEPLDNTHLHSVQGMNISTGVLSLLIETMDSKVDATAGRTLSLSSSLGLIANQGSWVDAHTDEPGMWSLVIMLEEDAPWSLETYIEDEGVDRWEGNFIGQGVGFLVNTGAVQCRRPIYQGTRHTALWLNYAEAPA